jgi:lipopolysaccharide export system protein LptA
MVAHFHRGYLTRIEAEGQVILDSQTEAGRRRASGESAVARYKSGLAQETLLEGDVRITEETDSWKLVLDSERCRLDPIANVLQADGEVPPRLQNKRDGETADIRADRIDIRSNGAEILARGDVESVVTGDDLPLVVTANQMKIDLDSEWIQYSGEPSLIQGMNLIAAKQIRLNSNSQELQARGEVKSVWVESETRRFDIEAGELDYKKGEGRASYRDNVTVTAEELEVQAPLVDLFFLAAEGNQLDRLEARGGVQIVEHGRTWTGRRATYYRDEDRFQVENR